MVKVAFDVDGCLIDDNDDPKWANIALLRWFINNGHDVVIWSGGGADYARMWACRLLGRNAVDMEHIVTIRQKPVRVIQGTGRREGYLAQEIDNSLRGDWHPDIAFDDEHVQLGTVNIKVDYRPDSEIWKESMPPIRREK